MIVELPPLTALLFVSRWTLTRGFNHMWIVMVARCPASALSVCALALAAFWLWTMFRTIPQMAALIMGW